MCRPLFLLFAVVASCSGIQKHSSRLHGGVDADIKDTPYMAAIEKIGFRFVCGAVIISSEWVLTDAYCQYYPFAPHFQVRVGTALSNDGSGNADGVLHNVVEWIRHPEADVLNRRNDFTLVKVTPPFQFNENVTAATLPALGQDTPAGAVGVVAGWGQTGNSVGSVTQLQSATLSLIGDSECNSILAGNYTLNILCARNVEGAAVSLCWQDEGGPLVYDGTVYGIVLWSQSCRNPDNVQLFSKVASVREWIDSTIGSPEIKDNYFKSM